MKRPANRRGNRSGILLLLVLTALTFFSLLIAAYLVFTNEAHKTASLMSNRNTRAPDVDWIVEEALMTLVRGTDDVQSPFYGEDLMSDYLGVTDSVTLNVASMNDPNAGPVMVGNGFVRFPIIFTDPDTNATRRHYNGTGDAIDDLYTGRVVTFLEGPLENKSFRVLRSFFRPRVPNPIYDDLFIEISPNELAITASLSNVRALFYQDPNDLSFGGFEFLLNGVPRNSPGIGYSTTSNNVDQTIADDPDLQYGGTNQSIGYTNLAVALQPNHIRRLVDKSTMKGDFDESYDAADYNNWWLSHTSTDAIGNTVVIPSFHRPSVLNFILNEESDWSNQTNFSDIMASFSRGTFRPLPIADGQLGTNVPGINQRFTGGNSSYALRLPLRMEGSTGASRLNQLSRALIEGPWDVDNDNDGVNDSIWVDLGLPFFTSPEGKLLKPLIAPLIEDLGGRLNVNAHGSVTNSSSQIAQSTRDATWAGSRRPFGNDLRLTFRGIGYGPADISIPALAPRPGNNGYQISTEMTAEINDLVTQRYQANGETVIGLAGRVGRDSVDAIQNGYRPPVHLTDGAVGYSEDPFGRGGYGIGRSGHLLTALAGLRVSTGSDNSAPDTLDIDEAVNGPYESDPSGGLSGDEGFTLAELETILRSKEFSTELLPQGLSSKLRAVLRDHDAYARSLTTTSRSDDTPAPFDDEQTALQSLVKIMNQRSQSPTPLNNVQISRLIAPELRLGRKLDVNRRFGNGLDDNGNGIIDEPRELFRADANGTDDNGNGESDEPGEPVLESQAFLVRSGAVGVIPNGFQNVSPNYVADEPAGTEPFAPFTTPQVDGRQLLARHLYVLMMTLSRDLESPGQEFEFPSVASPRPASFNSDRYKARRLAQWAVNVVDYRDPDSINTRFVFDANPFAGGWNPPAEDSNTRAPDYNVVWGVEAPQLILTETLALHDVRLNDSDRDNGEGTVVMPDPPGTNPDNDSDQVRIPQGSLFLELLDPRPVVINADQNTKPAIDLSMYRLIGDQYELNLGAQSPRIAEVNNNTAPLNYTGAPIWRIAITEPHYSNVDSGKDQFDPETVSAIAPDSASFEIADPDELATSAPATFDDRLLYDRFIWFTDFEDADTNPDSAYSTIETFLADNNINDMLASQVFFAPTLNGETINGDRTLQPGQFLTLAPRFDTRVGSKTFGGFIPGLPSEQSFQLGLGQGIVQFDLDGDRVTPPLAFNAAYTPALPMLIATVRPPGWSVGDAAHPHLANNVVGLSVSEPRPRAGNYYPQPTFRYNGTEDQDSAGGEDYLLTDAYVDFSTGGSTAVDEPMDRNIDRIPFDVDEPFLGTLEQYCSVLLQRLADPTMPYDEDLNPYRTVDYMAVDLTVFSGEDYESSIASSAGDYAHRSRQKNGNIKDLSNLNGPGLPASALYSYETNDITSEPLDTSAGDDFFRFAGLASPWQDTGHFYSSLSYLNTAPIVTGNPQIPSNPNFVGFANSIGSLGAQASGVLGNERNYPQVPYAIHPWLNRPFATPMELMMVPASSQGRLFEEFSVVTGNPDPTIYTDPGNPEDPIKFNAPFRHLLNFFYNGEGGDESPEFHRIFDMVHTLPRFRGEVDYITPARLAVTGGNDPMVELRSLLLPPFNYRYDNVREATVNLNSIGEFPVWAGVMQGHVTGSEIARRSGDQDDPQYQLSYDNFLNSRRGYPLGSTTKNITQGGGGYRYTTSLNPDYPTQFAGVFKRQIDTPFAPRLEGRTNLYLLNRREIHGGLLRGTDKIRAASQTESALSLLKRNPDGLTPLFVRSNSQENPLTRNRKQNAFMRYQTLMRMPNLVSDNSQVFVIRFTVGFFEVDPNDTNSLGREYLADIGQNQRHRAMFVVDRSVPVGFTPGKNLNTRDVVVFESRD